MDVVKLIIRMGQVYGTCELFSKQWSSESIIMTIILSSLEVPSSLRDIWLLAQKSVGF